MSWGFSRTWAHIFALVTLWIDQKCREDLNKNLLVSERDYVSRFLTHLMYPSGPFQKKSDYIFWNSRTNDGGTEQNSGTDGIIVFTYKGKYKICIFEAKWPRYFIKKNYAWDNIYSITDKYSRGFESELKYYNSSSSMIKKQRFSRFSNELMKQKQYSPQVAIWEMFFYEAPVGKGSSKSPYFNNWGSTCVWFEEAFNHLNYYKGGFQWDTWNKNDLEQLFLGVKPGTFNENRENGLSIYSIIYDILTCKKGDCLDNSAVTSNHIILKGKNTHDDEVSIRIPLFDLTDNQVQKFQIRAIDDYLTQNEFTYYIAIDLAKCIKFVLNKMKKKPIFILKLFLGKILNLIKVK